jgi:hypothetical protein
MEGSMNDMLMFWVDESAEVTEDDDAAMMIAVASWVEENSIGRPPMWHASGSSCAHQPLPRWSTRSRS